MSQSRSPWKNSHARRLEGLIVENGDAMARVVDLALAADDISRNLACSFQYANVNFLIGSGASWPAIPSAGNVEKGIAELFDAGDEEAAAIHMSGVITSGSKPYPTLCY